MIARIVSKALPFVLLACSAASAQTTYNITGGPYHDGYYPPYIYTFDIQLSGTGNSISWVTGAPFKEWGCGNGKPTQGGFIFYTINGVSPGCANSVTYTVSGSVTVDGCTGPAKAVETFDDNSTLTVYWTYDKNGGRWHNLCEAWIASGTLVTNP